MRLRRRKGEPVYCNPCAFLGRGESGGYGCVHPSNIRRNWLSPTAELIHSPRERNGHNDCPDFVPMPQKEKP